MTYNLIPYIGGKSKMLREIYNNMPDFDDFETFIDLFGGSGNVILNLPQKYYKEKNVIYNDINDDLVNLMLQVKNNFEEFINAIDLPYSESLYKKIYKQIKTITNIA